ncbi:hypothetical protein SKAU_G00236030 [Synaphobranchus kaupii]|uniref:Uncharacterized protein n=1 Tax=Synaphobranchus kaupii TaxID=118154 RepID=A0A9Q1F6I8_SYNKA|nr:hypothetical protein SKAU_G00236030 [Synaphobranchus kaupii]
MRFFEMSVNNVTSSSSLPVKRKRLSKYRTEWQTEHEWVSPVSGNEYKANCTVCHRVFSVAHGGLSDLKQHSAGHYHIRAVAEDAEWNRSVHDTPDFPRGRQIRADTVKHNLSYNSSDCAQKLYQKMLPDSKVAKKICCGRTKAESLVKDVLAPKAVEDVVGKLKKDETPLPFSIQTDASNKGNRKMFPVVVQFLTPECGVVNKMIDFVKNPNESAEGIVRCLLHSLETLGLKIEQVSAFSADNANVNFGVHNSVYTMLRKQQINLLQGNCHAHIVHNTLKHALDNLSVDVENVVLKVYGFFSISAKRREALKEFCEFCDIEFREVLRHVTTRWLSLNPAITRLLQSWSALKSYFISLGDECPKQIRTLLRLTTDSGVQEDDGNVVKVYLLFCNNILYLFEKVVKKLEASATTCVELYPIMHSFSAKLKQRRDDQFYGYLTKTKLQHLSPVDAGKAREELIDTALRYIEKWFDFSESNWLHCLPPLSLHDKLTFNDLGKICNKLHLMARVNMDDLYDDL